jgi:hypothetical protein
VVIFHHWDSISHYPPIQWIGLRENRMKEIHVAHLHVRFGGSLRGPKNRRERMLREDAECIFIDIDMYKRLQCLQVHRM